MRRFLALLAAALLAAGTAHATWPDRTGLAPGAILEVHLDESGGAPADNQCLTYNAAGLNFTWQACTGGAYSWDLSGDTGVDETVTDTDVGHFAGGVGITTAVSATDTLTITFAPAELDGATWGDNTTGSWVWDAGGASDPLMAYADDFIAWTNVATFTLDGSQVLVATDIGSTVQAEGTNTRINDLVDSDGDATVQMAEFRQQIKWNTGDNTAAAFEGIVFLMQYDPDTTDSGDQYLVVIRQSNTAADQIGQPEALLLIEQVEATADDGALAGIKFNVLNNGAMPTAIDASDAEIDDAINIGSNPIQTTTNQIEATMLDRLFPIDAALVDLDDSPAWSGDHTLPTVSGKQKRNTTAVAGDNDCTGEQGSWWYDTTDNQFEFCDANSGVPKVVGTDAPLIEVPLNANMWTIPGLNGAVEGIFAAAGNFERLSLDFAAAGVTDAALEIEIPTQYDNTFDPTLAVIWTADSASTNDVCWCIHYADYADGASMDPSAEANSNSDCASGPNAGQHLRNTDTITIDGADLAAGNTLLLRLFRDGSEADADCAAGSDDLSTLAQLHTVFWTYRSTGI